MYISHYVHLFYGCESWTMTLHNQKRLISFENKVLRNICGPVQDLTSGEWRRRSEEEVRAMTNQPYISSLAREIRLEWAGHVVRAPKTRDIRNLHESYLPGRRPPGRPRQRWLDNVIRDLQNLDVGVEWERLAQDRMIWRGITREARALQGWYGHRK